MWNNHERIFDINGTLLVLITKLDNSEFISQFRPIAVCNVSYKCLTKIIVNRLKPLLNSIISLVQVSFVPGRNIQDNIIVAQEMVHSMKRMRGNKSFKSIKIDLEKAYDRLSWSFIQECLEALNLPNPFVTIIVACINSTSFRVLWNGDKWEEFFPIRGIRQGDPLSLHFCNLYAVSHLSHF